jgi:glycosyltransferase involved in cell wall biosynthesis
MINSRSPLLSICCLGYNHQKFCEKAIRSIWNQDYNNIEIIAIEDGSTDNTYEILCNLAKISPFPMKVLTQQNTYNIGYNLNRALKEAKGELVMMTSLDDYYLPNVFGTLVNEILEDNYIQFVATEPCETEVCFDKSNVNYNNISKKELLDLEKSAGGFWLHSTIWRKSIIDAVDGFDEDMTGDDIVLRTKVLKYMLNRDDLKFKITQKLKNEEVFKHVMHEKNISYDSKRQCRILQEVMDRYFPGEHSETLDSWIKNANKQEELKKNKIKFFIYSLIKKIYKILVFLGVGRTLKKTKIFQFVKKFI